LKEVNREKKKIEKKRTRKEIKMGIEREFTVENGKRRS